MYESPIQEIVGEICKQINQQKEEIVMMQVEQSIGYRVDREELLKALQYDRDNNHRSR